jgi:ABC-type branched-subunit amino acid transport system permease subunit
VHYSQTGWADGRPDARDVRAEFPYEAAMAENAAHPERFHLAFLHSGVTAVFDVGGYPWTRTLGAATETSAYAPHVAAAGALLATYHPIEPTVAGNFIVLMFVAVVLGGLGSIPGAFVGGLVIGVVQSLTLLVLPFQLQNVGVFIAFLLVLYLRPQGLFGRRLRAV